jgi:hypothetical protein
MSRQQFGLLMMTVGFVLHTTMSFLGSYRAGYHDTIIPEVAFSTGLGRGHGVFEKGGQANKKNGSIHIFRTLLILGGSGPTMMNHTTIPPRPRGGDNKNHQCFNFWRSAAYQEDSYKATIASCISDILTHRPFSRGVRARKAWIERQPHRLGQQGN